MKNNKAKTQAAINDINAQIEFKTDVIALVDDLLFTSDLHVPVAHLVEKKNRLLNECSALRLELKLTQQFLSSQRGQAHFLS